MDNNQSNNTNINNYCHDIASSVWPYNIDVYNECIRRWANVRVLTRDEINIKMNKMFAERVERHRRDSEKK